MQKINRDSRMLTIGILSISFLMSVSNAVSGTVPLMQEHFSSMSQASIEMLVVIPTGGVLIGTVISGLISNALGKKNTVLCGLIVSLISGVIPAFIYNYPCLFLSRLFFGVGMGIFTPLSVSYITDVFAEEKRNKLLGWRNSVGAIGDSLMLFIAGFLINISWHTTYLVFFALLIPIVLVQFFVPKELDNIESSNDGKLEEVSAEVSKKKPTTNLKVIKLAMIFLFCQLFYSAISLKFATYLVQNDIGTAADATRIFGVLVFCSIISGIIFEKIVKVSGKFTVAIFDIVTAAVMMLIPFTTSIPLLLVLVLISGFCNGIINPALTARMVAYSPEGSMNLTTSIIIIGINIGSLVSPYFFQYLGELINNSGAATLIFWGGALYILLALYDVFTVKKDHLTL